MCAEPFSMFFLSRRLRTTAPFLACTFAMFGITSYLLLLVRNGLSRTFAGACVGFRTLTSDRKASSVSLSTVAADFNQAFDVERDVSSQVAFNAVAFIDFFTQLRDLVVRQVFDARIGIDAACFQNVV